MARSSKSVLTPLISRMAVVLFLLAAVFPSLANNFTVSIDRDTITQGESATLSLKFEGAEPAEGFSMPAVPGLSISDPSRSVSSFISIVNGRQESSSTVEYQYSVSASGPGSYKIPPLSAILDGKMFVTQPIVLKVTQAEKRKPGSGTAYLTLTAAATNVFVGQVIPVEIQLYYQAAQGGELPHFNQEGFTLGKMLPPAQSSTTINGVQYNIATMKTYVVPVKAGTLQLGPVGMNINIPRSGARNIFGQLVDWQQVNLESDPVVMSVNPVPQEARPSNYTGAVGTYTMSLTATPTNIAVGDPLTVKIAISGTGALDNLTLQNPQGWDHFKIYPPTSDTQLADNLGITGTKTFSLTVVPDSLDVHELPPFSFSYFDPELRRFNSLQHGGIPLTIRPSAASLPMTTTSSGTVNPAPQANNDLAPIKVHFGKLETVSRPLVLQGWFLTSQAIPVVLALSCFVWRKRKDALLNNPRLLRQRQVENLIRKGMDELKERAAANDAEKFYATIFRLLQEKIGDCLGVAASGITESVVDEKLKPAGLANDPLVAIHELFQACNQARYSRHSSPSELGNQIPKLQTALNQLEAIRS